MKKNPSGVMTVFHCQPWADTLRPTIHSLETLTGHAKQLWDFDLKQWRAGQRSHLVLWGPPGCGKTTLALLLAQSHSPNQNHFRHLSAVRDGIAEIKKALDALQGGGLLFIDEIHRLTRPQQDLLLPVLESGDCWLVAATTESPSGVLTPALLSRIRTIRVHPPKVDEIAQLLQNSINQCHQSMGKDLSDEKKMRIEKQWIPVVAKRCDGDVRLALNLIEGLLGAYDETGEKEVLSGQLRAWTSKNHYDYASAMIKSMRGSDPDAALFYAHAALESGEDPLFILRRCIIFASEDVGNADPAALRVALDCFEAFQKLGFPEGRYALAQAVTYLAATVKSNRLLLALNSVSEWWKKEAHSQKNVAAPVHLIVKGHEKYRYPHDYPGSFVREQYLPPAIESLRKQSGAAYLPSEEGVEVRLKNRLKMLWSR